MRLPMRCTAWPGISIRRPSSPHAPRGAAVRPVARQRRRRPACGRRCGNRWHPRGQCRCCAGRVGRRVVCWRWRWLFRRRRRYSVAAVAAVAAAAAAIPVACRGVAPVVGDTVGDTAGPILIAAPGPAGNPVGPPDSSGSAVSGAPEPAAWAFMVIGFGLVGAIARARPSGIRQGSLKVGR